MEDEKVHLIDEEISYYSTTSSFGIGMKKIQSPKNIHISFTPLSSNHKISFSNTIMIPFITTEPSKESQKNMTQNISNMQNEKSKLSVKRDHTRLKTESSKDENNNISIEKKVTKILIENDITEIDENTNEIDFTNKEESKNNLETNPFF